MTERQKPNKLHDWWDMNQPPVNEKFWICSYCSCCSRDDCYGDGCKEKAARPCTHERKPVSFGHDR